MHTKKEGKIPLFSVPFLEAVAASAVFAIACVSNVNTVEFAVHSIGIELAFGNAAGNAVIDRFCHFRPSFLLLSPVASVFMCGTVDKSFILL